MSESQARGQENGEKERGLFGSDEESNSSNEVGIAL